MLDRLRGSYEAEAATPPGTTKACALIGANDERIPLPTELCNVLCRAAEILAVGDSVTIVSVEKELTTQEAADMLNMSRQYLVRLLDADAIPHHRVNSHRRIRLQDLLAFKSQRDSERRDALRNLTRITEEVVAPDTFPDQETE